MDNPEKQEEIDWLNAPDTRSVFDGWDTSRIPDFTPDNFRFLIEKHNDLVRSFNALLDMLKIEEE